MRGISTSEIEQPLFSFLARESSTLGSTEFNARLRIFTVEKLGFLVEDLLIILSSCTCEFLRHLFRYFNLLKFFAIVLWKLQLNQKDQWSGRMLLPQSGAVVIQRTEARYDQNVTEEHPGAGSDSEDEK